MISICIPVYNFDITLLVKAIERQKVCADFELVVIDDGSKEGYKNNNKECLKDYHYIELPQNIGRSKIRNLFKKYVKYNYMLFMDCDSMICEDGFLQRYVESIEPDIVIYGGRVYPAVLPTIKQKMSWSYGVEVESKKVEERKEKSYLSFMTNNFLIDKSVFEKISFNEKIDDYGHEDTFFGYELELNKIKILHIRNPVLNVDIESNERFVIKNEIAIKNLIRLSDKLNNKGFYNHVQLLSFYEEMNKIQIWIVKMFFSLFQKIVRKKMIEGFYSKKILNFYKLGYLIKLKH